MKRFFAGMLSLLGILALALSAAILFLPFDTIVLNVPWLGFIERLKSLDPFVRYIAGGGALLAIGFGIWYILLRRAESAELAAATVTVSSTNQIDSMYQADNADVRARVRDLLHRAWGGPLLALILGALPIVAIHAGVHIFLEPVTKLWRGIYSVFSEFISQMGGIKTATALIVTGTLPDMSSIVDSLISAAPGLIILIVAWAFIFQPIRVSRASYFMQLLYGKKPSPLSTFSCFSENYVRALGGMAYCALWLIIWGIAMVAVPLFIYIGGMTVINAYPEELNSYLLWLVPSLAGLSILSFVVLLFKFIDRALAYSLVPCVISSQRELPARRAMRASRYLTRGHKGRLLGMWLSFLYYFLPTIGALLLLPLITPLGAVFGFPEYLKATLTRFFLIIIGANQLLLLYVGPLAWSSFYAFYLEMKREYRQVHPTRLYILGILPKQPQPYKQDEKPSEQEESADGIVIGLPSAAQRRKDA